MESLQHLRLLLWKNFTLKKRQPIVLLLELVWPVLLMVPLVTFRRDYPPEVHDDIWFGSRGLPSAGLIPFMQGIVCDPNVQLRDSHELPDSHDFVELNPHLSDFVRNVTVLAENPQLTWQNAFKLVEQLREVLSDERNMESAYEQYEKTANLEQLKKDLGLPQWNDENGVVHLQEMLTNQTEFDQFLVHKLNFSKQEAVSFSESSVNLGEFQKFLLLGVVNLHHCLSMSDLTELGSCYYQVKNSPMGGLEGILQAVLSLGDSRENPLSSGIILQKLACSNGSEFQRIFVFSSAKTGVKHSLCTISDDQAIALSRELQHQLTFSGHNHTLKMANSSLYEHFMTAYSKLLEDYEPFSQLGDYITATSQSNPSLVELHPLKSLFHVASPAGNISSLSDIHPGDFLTGKHLQVGLDLTCNVLCGPTNRRCKKTAGKGKAPLKAASESKARTELSVFDRLLRGFKILYAPNTTLAHKIIQEANSTMNDIENLKQFAIRFVNETVALNSSLESILQNFSLTTNFSRSFVSSGCSLSSVLMGKNLTSVLASSGMASQGLQALVDDLPIFHSQIQKRFGVTSLGNASDSLAIIPASFCESYGGVLDAIFNSSLADQMKALTEAAHYFIDGLNSVDLNIWHGFEDEDSLVEYAGEATKNGSTVWAGVVFTNLESGNGSLPKHVEYKIKMNKTMVYPTNALKDKFWTPGPRRHDYDLQYVVFGFVYIQDMIDRGITRLQLNGTAVREPGVYIQQFPYPCYIDDRYARAISTTLPLFMALAWVFSVAMITRGIVHEKEQRLRVIMKVMGLKNSSMWGSWLLTSFLLLTIVSFFLSLLMKYGQILMNSNLLLVFLFLVNYALATISLCCLISTLFNYANLAACSAGIIYLFSYLPSIVYSHYEQELGFSEKGLLCLLSSTAFGAAVSHVARFEEQGSGIQWHNMGESLIIGDSFSFLSANLFLLVDAILYLLMAVYIDSIFPGQYGIPQPWYFPFLPSYWRGQGTACCGKSALKEYVKLEDKVAVEQDDDGQNEPINPSLKTGVSVQNLMKSYDNEKKIAVPDLSIDFYEDQITCLLGQNGAGKTTTLSVLTGLFPPTSGSVLVNGMDIRTQTSEIKKIVGMCPQHSILFHSLTVAEHLWLFAKLKGATKALISAEVDRWVDNLGLASKRHARVSQLSGGMQRKLCVAMAYIANSKVIILDEPTAGIDPFSRRGVWDLIAQHRHGRTVILSTHYMDEADVLGDRIAILHRGRLRCVGSSHFLKRKFSDGFHLTLTRSLLSNSFDSREESVAGSCVGDLVTSHVRDARLVGRVGMELSYLLPTENNDQLAALLADLEARGKDFGVSGFGLSASPLEEVFLKVTRQSDDELETDPTTGHSFFSRLRRRRRLRRRLEEDQVPLDEEVAELSGDDDDDDDLNGKTNDTETADIHCANPDTFLAVASWSLYWQQFKTLFHKNFLNTRRFYKGFLAQVILPVLFVSVALLFRMLSSDPKERLLQLTPTLYPPPNYFPLRNYQPGEEIAETVKAMFAQPCGLSPSYSASNFSACSSSQGGQWESIGGNQSSNGSCWCTDGQSFCPEGIQLPFPRQLKTFDGLMTIQDMRGKIMSEYIKETTRYYRYKRYGGATIGNENPSYSATNQTLLQSLGMRQAAKAWFNNKGYHTMPSYLNTLDNAILRAYLNVSENPLQYGISTYSDPFESTSAQLISDKLASGIDVLIAVCIIFALAFVPPSFIIILIQERSRGVKHLQLVSGVHPIVYWLSTYAWHMCNYIVTVVCIAVVFFAFHEDVYSTMENFSAVVALLLLYGWAMIPLVYPATFLFRDGSTAYVMTFSITLLIGLSTTLATYIYQIAEQYEEKYASASNLLQSLFLIFPNYCLGRGLMDIAYNYYVRKVNTQLEGFGLGLPVSNLLSLEKRAIGRNLISMGIGGLVYFAFVLLIEFRFFRKKKWDSKRKSEHNDISAKDEDVLQERRTVSEGRTDGAVLVLDHVGKTYRSRLSRKVCRALDDVCLSVPRGQCFGLLGVNGAGKTTTFKILTGDIVASSGDAIVLNHSVSNELNKSRKRVGYCPQMDAIYDLLTGREHLTLYARLKGMKSNNVPKIVNWCLEKLALTHHADVKAGKYSGGNKRKLSTAIALIGQPDVLLLDEPTTGMDPKARRFLWAVISSLVAQGKSIILTSHSMEECEALCGRIGILVNGSLCCLGSPQHLKNKYGDGYTVTIRCCSDASGPNLTRVKAFFSRKFPSAQLKDEHLSTVEYQFLDKDTCLSYVFSEMEKSKGDLCIEDYSVSQTTMDQVFVNFAKVQTDGNDTEEQTSASFLARLQVWFNAHRQTVTFSQLPEEGDI